jgi:hypothetical protein
MDNSFSKSMRIGGAKTSEQQPQGDQQAALTNWLNDFQAADTETPKYEVESIADQINAMPNSEKLTPTERWLYQKLPGVGESSIGKALMTFTQWEPAAKVLRVLDVGAEGLERSLGVMAQFRDRDPDEQFRLKDAWAAGSLFWDVARLPRLRYDDKGNVVGIRVDNEMPGAYALTDVRREIASGKKLEEVRDVLYQNLGALAIRAQINDALGHTLGDPLGWALTAIKPVQRLHAVRHLALTQKIDPSAVRAMEQAARLSGDIESANKFAEALTKAEQSGKALTRFERFAINATGGVPYLKKTDKGYEVLDIATMSSKQKLGMKLNPFALTPQARASEMLDMVAGNLGEMLIVPNLTKDPAEFIKALSGAARGAIGSEWGHIAMTIQGRTVQGFLAEAEAGVKVLGKEWSTFANERRLLEAMSAASPGSDARKLWSLANKNPEQFMKNLVEASMLPGGEWLKAELAAGRITPDIVTQIAKIDRKIPLLKDEFYARATVMVQDVAVRQAILKFGISEKGALTKWADALKSWESIPFIRANPANAFRNVINNEVTLVGRGLYGTFTPGGIRNYWKGKWIPPQFKRGFSLSGEVLEDADAAFDPGNAIKQIVDVLEGNGGLAGKVKEAANKMDLKIMDFSKVSAKMEKEHGLRASTLGWIEFHNKYWNPRTGFTSFAKHADAATLQQIEELMPGLADTLDDIAQAAQGDVAKFAELMQSNIDHNITTVMKNVSDRLGYKLDEVIGTEVMAKLQEGLPEAIAKGQVEEYVTGVRTQMEAHVDEMFNRHLENLPGIIAAQVQAGGPFQFNRHFAKATDELWGGNIEHSRRMSTINEMLDYARESGDYGKVGTFWNKIQVDSENHFRRIWSKFDAYQKGLQEGAANAGLKYPPEVAESFKGIRKGWEDLFAFRNKEYQKVFDSIKEGGVPKQQFDAIRDQIAARVKAMTKSEDQYYQQIDDLMAKQLPDPVQRKMYQNYRDKASELRINDREKTAEFFDAVRHARKEEVPGMWQKYWNEKGMRLEQMRQLDAQGSAAIQGDERATAAFFGDVSPTDQPPQNVYELASRYGISSTSKKGVRNDRRVLATVNKYSKETSATDVDIVDNALLPDDVKTAFKSWDEAKQAVKEAQKAGDDPLLRKEAVSAAKKLEKEARQAYNDALEANKIDGGMIDKLLKDRTFMDPNKVPMNVAQEAFEAQKASKVTKATQAAKDQGFIPDAEKYFPDPQPIETGMSELNYGRSYAALDAIVEEATATSQKSSRLLKDLPPELQKKVTQWGRQLESESGSFRAAGVQYASFRRDSALLNYNRRTNFDNWVGHMAPFAFWSTHSVFNWAIHSLDRPAMMTSYFRSRQFFETAGLTDQNVPERLKGNIRMSLPFVPDWMGDVFVNPTRFMLPFDAWMAPVEQAHQSKFTEGNKIERTLEQMLEKGMITEEQYNEALTDKGGDAYEQARLQVREGGENYDAMDFMSMTMTPHAPLMWAYNAMRGEKSEIGPFTPMSRTAKNVATMLGVEDWSNSPYNVEARIRREMGLPAYDKWDNYRVGRSISNLAVDGKYDMKEIKEAMEIAALVEAGKMTSAEAVKTNKVYKEATLRSDIEQGGNVWGVIGNLIGMPARAYPEGEQIQRDMAEKFSDAYAKFDKGDVTALNDFFDEYPEYEARLALFKSPEERLKSFMVDHIWSRYNELPQIHKDEMREQLGQNFETHFLNKETRSYDNLTPEQLNIYLKLMGGKTVGKLSATEEALVEFNQLKLTDPETAWRVETFYSMRKEDFPDWSTLQNEYYKLPEGSVSRNKFKNNNPQLTEYWDARRQWMEQNPDLVRYLTDDEKQIKKYELIQRQPDIAVPTAQELRANMSPEMNELVMEWATGEDLPPSVMSYLDQMAGQYGNISSREMLGILTGR